MKHHLLNISSVNCRFEAFVNDVLVFGNTSGDSTAIELQINHLVRERENTVVARVLPPPGLDALEGNSRMEVAVFAMEDNPWNQVEARVQLTSIQTDRFRIPGVDAMPLIEAPGAFLAPEAAPLPWEEAPEWRLERRDLELAESTYARIHERLARRDTAGVMDMMLEKCESCARCYGMSTLDFTDYVRRSIERLAGDPDLRLLPLKEQQFRPRIFGGGRLLAAFNERSKPLIAFLDRDAGVTSYLDVFIMKDPQGRAIVIR
jgi:hypothetical protein